MLASGHLIASSESGEMVRQARYNFIVILKHACSSSLMATAIPDKKKEKRNLKLLLRTSTTIYVCYPI